MLFLLFVFLNLNQFSRYVDPQSFIGLSREVLIKCYFQSDISCSKFLVFLWGINMVCYENKIYLEDIILRIWMTFWSYTKRNVRIWINFRVSDNLSKIILREKCPYS